MWGPKPLLNLHSNRLVFFVSLLVSATATSTTQWLY